MWMWKYEYGSLYLQLSLTTRWTFGTLTTRWLFRKHISPTTRWTFRKHIWDPDNPLNLSIRKQIWGPDNLLNLSKTHLRSWQPVEPFENIFGTPTTRWTFRKHFKFGILTICWTFPKHIWGPDNPMNLSKTHLGPWQSVDPFGNTFGTLTTPLNLSKTHLGPRQPVEPLAWFIIAYD